MNMDMAIMKTDREQDRIFRKTKDLTSALCHTEIYHQYQKNLAILKKHEDIWGRLNEFRRRNINLDPGDEYFRDQEEALRKEYEDILGLPVVMNYLTSESLLNKMLRMVYDSIAEDILIDLSYMGE